MRRRARVLILVAVILALAAALSGTSSVREARVTTPREFLGSNIGDDYFLATYSELEAYWKELDRESDRLSLVNIGSTEEGRPQWMAVVTAPENFERLPSYRELSRRLALADRPNDNEARALAAEGKAVVLIAGGLHATETLGAQQLIETVYRLVSGSDAETLRILRDVIVLAVDANPDGHDLVANWYMRQTDPLARSLDGLPRLDQRYAGHDNNRDFYAATQAETRNLNRVMYNEWFPQIVYDHHQSGLPGAVMFAPPFDGPANYVLDPLIAPAIDLAGMAIHARMAAEGKRGVTMRSGSPYSTWWNGGLRTTAYFHNQIGLLSEIVGGPAPMTVPVTSARHIPRADLPMPIQPQRWRFRDALEYAVSANMAVLDVASRHRETWLHNAYVMARSSIERGSRDWWTVPPHRGSTHTPEAAARDARAYILPADQPDLPTATKFVNALLSAGVAVHRAVEGFAVRGRTYPEGTYVVRTAQAFRPHVLDMFEPQDHPGESAGEGGAPDAPYDIAGWTLAFQMGVKFDRVLEEVEGPFEQLRDTVPAPRRSISGPPDPAGYLLRRNQNDSAIAVNRLLKAGGQVFSLEHNSPVTSARTGDIFVAATPVTTAIVQDAAARLGLTVTGLAQPASGRARLLRPARVALVDRYGGWSSSGWVRWILERFEYPFDVVYPPALLDGGLAENYDVVILPSEAAPVQPKPSNAMQAAAVPPEYFERLGDVTVSETVPALKRYVERGGTLIAIGRAASIGYALGLPLANPLVQRQPDGSLWPLPANQYYVPGSILRASVDSTTPLGHGFEREVDVFFNNGPAFELLTDASSRRVHPVAWFATAVPLRSGWARGQQRLKDTAAVVDAPLGRGRVLLFGPEITFRGQSHGTFKFLFNGIRYATSRATNVTSTARGSRAAGEGDR
jgi:hypothetical protein